jgi:hypothetical protein
VVLVVGAARRVGMRRSSGAIRRHRRDDPAERADPVQIGERGLLLTGDALRNDG